MTTNEAPVLDLEPVTTGRWAGKYRIEGFLCDELGNLLDEGACSGCAGHRFVKEYTSRERPWETRIVVCPRCWV